MTSLTTTTQDAEVQALAAKLGEDAKNISIIQAVNWEALSQEGAVVSLSVGRWRGKVQLQFEDLGLQPKDEQERRAWERLFVPGSRYLLPKPILDRASSLESKGRENLKRFGIRTYWGRYVHETKYADWRSEDTTLEAAYRALAQEIYDTWDDLIRQVRQDYAIAALQNWNRFRQAGINLGDVDEWVPIQVERAMTRLETREAVLYSFKWERTVRKVPLAASIAADVARADRIRQEATIERNQRWAVEAEKNRIAAENSLQADLVRTAAREQADGLKQFVGDIVADIRTRVYDAVSDSLEAAKGNGGKLPRNSTKQLRGLIEAVERLDVWSDPDLESKIKGLEALIDTAPDKRDANDVKRVLVDLGAEARATILELDRIPARSARKGGVIPEELPEIVEATARRRSPSAAPAINLLDDDLLARPAARRGGRRAPTSPELLAI